MKTIRTVIISHCFLFVHWASVYSQVDSSTLGSQLREIKPCSVRVLKNGFEIYEVPDSSFDNSYPTYKYSFRNKIWVVRELANLFPPGRFDQELESHWFYNKLAFDAFADSLRALCPPSESALETKSIWLNYSYNRDGEVREVGLHILGKRPEWLTDELMQRMYFQAMNFSTPRIRSPFYERMHPYQLIEGSVVIFDGKLK